MALSNKRIIITADTVVGSTKVATHSASITVSGDDKKMTMTSNYPDKDTYNSNKATVDADQTEFETYVETLYTGTAIYG